MSWKTYDFSAIVIPTDLPRTYVGSRARAANGHAAAPPGIVMNSGRLMGFPQGQGYVGSQWLWQDHNHPHAVRAAHPDEGRGTCLGYEKTAVLGAEAKCMQAARHCVRRSRIEEPNQACVPWAIALVRDRRLGVRRVCPVLLDATDEIERGVQRLVVLRIRRDIGLRAGLLVAFGLKVSAQRRLAARIGARFELLRHLLQHLDVGRDTLRLDRTSGRSEVAGGGQPQRAIAGAERDDGLQRSLAERARAD